MTWVFSYEEKTCVGGFQHHNGVAWAFSVGIQRTHVNIISKFEPASCQLG